MGSGEGIHGLGAGIIEGIVACNCHCQSFKGKVMVVVTGSMGNKASLSCAVGLS